MFEHQMRRIDGVAKDVAALPAVTARGETLESSRPPLHRLQPYTGFPLWDARQRIHCPRRFVVLDGLLFVSGSLDFGSWRHSVATTHHQHSVPMVAIPDPHAFRGHRLWWRAHGEGGGVPPPPPCDDQGGGYQDRLGVLCFKKLEFLTYYGSEDPLISAPRCRTALARLLSSVGCRPDVVPTSGTG